MCCSRVSAVLSPSPDRRVEQCEKPWDPGSKSCLRKPPQIFSVWIADIHKWLICIYSPLPLHPNTLSECTTNWAYSIWRSTIRGPYGDPYGSADYSAELHVRVAMQGFQYLNVNFYVAHWILNWEILKVCCLNIPYPYKERKLRSRDIVRAAMCPRIGDFCQ